MARRSAVVEWLERELANVLRVKARWKPTVDAGVHNNNFDYLKWSKACTCYADAEVSEQEIKRLLRRAARGKVAKRGP